MAEKTTYIKVDRNIAKWRWYQNANTFRVFFHLLIKANASDNDFEGIVIHRGELATSYAAIAKELRLTEKEVRTALGHLKRTGEVAGKQYSKFQVISILSYDRYQAQWAGKRAPSGHPVGIQRAGNGQQYKNEKNNNKNIKKNSGSSASPLMGERTPAIGEGECMVEVDGFNHRFPKVWYEFAKKNGMTIQEYVRKRHQ